jgi:hypothetical protein
MAYEQVELSAVPFVTFIANKTARGENANYSFVLRGYVRHWLGSVWAEFDRVKLPEIVGSNVVGGPKPQGPFTTAPQNQIRSGGG